MGCQEFVISMWLDQDKGETRLTAVFRQSNRLSFALAVLFTVLQGAAQVFTAYLFKTMVDIATGGDFAQLRALLLICLAYICLYILVALANNHFRNRYITKAATQYKNRIFEGLLAKGVEADAAGMSSFQAGLSMDMESIESKLILGEINIIHQLLLFVLGLGVMFSLSLSITLVLLVSSLLPILISLYFNGKIPVLERRTSDESASFTAMLLNLLGGFSVIKIFSIEKEALALFQGSNEALEEAKKSRRTGKAALSLAMFVATFIITAALCGLGVYLTLRGLLTLGTVVAFIQLMDYVVSPASELGGLISERKAAAALVAKMEEQLQRKAQTEPGQALPDPAAPARGRASGVDGGGRQEALVSLSALRYSFAESQFTLEGIDFSFERGKHYLLVGPSGSGKSTLLKLILGYYPDYAGQIYFEDRDLRDLPRAFLYRQIAYVQQSTFIFDDSIINNVALYKSHDREKLARVLRICGLDAIISERGADYRCGVNGQFISGGEQQRIALARALLLEPRLLLLDEATSALDARANRLIMSSVLESPGLTSLSIMHRVEPALLKRFDCILLMDKGSLALRGSYAELSRAADKLLDVFLAE